MIATSSFVRVIALALVAACSTRATGKAPRELSSSPPAPSRAAGDAGSQSEASTADAASAAEVQSDDNAFVDMQSLDPTLLLDIRYASKRNFVKQVVYPRARCLLRQPVAQALMRVQKKLREQHKQLLLWDCYRPFAVQEQFWRLKPDARYVARPERKNGRPFKGSKHNRGAAVDLTLADHEGRALAMPTDHDDFSIRAHRGSQAAPLRARENAALLERVMREEGFVGIDTEWWHFDYQDWRSYQLSEHEL